MYSICFTIAICLCSVVPNPPTGDSQEDVSIKEIVFKDKSTIESQDEKDDDESNVPASNESSDAPDPKLKTINEATSNQDESAGLRKNSSQEDPSNPHAELTPEACEADATTDSPSPKQTSPIDPNKNTEDSNQPEVKESTDSENGIEGDIESRIKEAACDEDSKVFQEVTLNDDTEAQDVQPSAPSE